MQRGTTTGLAIVMWLAAFNAVGSPELSLSPLNAYVGGSGAIALSLAGGEESYYGVNVTFSLPPGISVVSVEPGPLLSDGFSIIPYAPPDNPLNTFSVAAYSTTDLVDVRDGVLLSLAVQVSPNPADVGVQPGQTIETAAVFLSSGLAGSDGQTSAPHTRRNGVVVLSLEPMPYLAVSPELQQVPAAAGQTSFAVTNSGNADMPWTATVLGGVDWLVITDGAGGTNNGTITVQYEQNGGPNTRSASVLVDAAGAPGSPVTVTVTQAGDATPILNVAPLTVEVPPGSGVIDIAVENTGNGVMQWSARVIAGIEWLNISSGNEGIGPGVISLVHYENPLAYSRTGLIEVTAPDALGSPMLVTIIQRAPAVLSVTPLTQAVPADAGEVAFNVTNLGTGTLDWTAVVVSGVDWLTIGSGADGTGDGVIGASYPANLSGAARTGSIRVQALGAVDSPITVEVTQAGNDEPFLSVAPRDQIVNARAETAEFSVTNLGNGSLQWVASIVEGADWLILQSGASGTEDGVIRLGFDQNTTPTIRSGVVRVTAEGADGSPSLVTIQQLAPVILHVTPNNQTIGPDGGIVAFEVANQGSGALTWSAELVSGAEWLTITSGTSGTGPGTIVASCASNSGDGSRSASILVQASGAAGSPVTVNVTQAPNTVPFLSVFPTEQTVSASAETAEFSVRNLGNGTMPWSAVIIDGVEWPVLEAGASGVEDGQIRLGFTPSATGTVRSCVLRVVAEGATGSPVEVTLRQLAPAILQVSPLVNAIGPEGGPVSFEVTNGGSGVLAWTAETISGADWLSITSGASAVGNATISVSCLEYSGENARSGTIRIQAPGAVGSPITVSVVQAGNNVPFLSVSPEEQTMDSRAEMAEFAVRNLGNGTLSWSANLVEGAEWVTIDSGASGREDGAIRLGFQRNGSPDLRTAVFEVTAAGAEGSPARVTLRQRGSDSLAVVGPNGGENLHRGTPASITWDPSRAKGVQAVMIAVIKGGSFHSTIAMTTENSGNYSWTVPSEMEPGADYQIQICDVSDPAVHDESDLPFAIACPPDAPSQVAASEGRPEGVVVTWSGVDAATEYEVYRGETDNVQSAQSIGTTTTLHFKDTTALPQTHTGFSCPRETLSYSYFYWVKALNGCAASDFSAADSGYRGFESDEEDEATYVKVLPGRMVDEVVYVQVHDEALCIRLRNQDEIDVQSVWGTVEGADIVDRTVEWLPLDENDGWVVYRPATPWKTGDTLEMTVGAKTASGEEMGPVSYTFVVGADKAADMDANIPVMAVPDTTVAPENGMIDDRVVVTTREPEKAAADAFLGAGSFFEIGPDRAFVAPQGVWLPLPSDTDSTDVSVWYLIEDGGSGHWHPGGDVEGWLVERNPEVVSLNGVACVTFQVRHGGTVWVGPSDRAPADPVKPSAASLAPTTGNGLTGDALLLGVVFLFLISRARQHRFRSGARAQT